MELVGTGFSDVRAASRSADAASGRQADCDVPGRGAEDGAAGMITLIGGLAALFFGSLNMIGSVRLIMRDQHERSDHAETNAILWFILAALFFK